MQEMVMVRKTLKAVTNGKCPVIGDSLGDAVCTLLLYLSLYELSEPESVHQLIRELSTAIGEV